MKKIIHRRKRTAEVLTWKEIRNQVISVNKELGKIIDSINPSDEYKFIKAKYLYGDLFIKNGVAQLPSSNNIDLAPVSSESIEKNIRKELSYNQTPLFLILEKDSECFIDTGSRAVPLNLFHKGSFSGTYETMDFLMGMRSKPIWNFSAGSRSIVMLPKITDKSGTQKLRMTYNIPTTVQIKQLSDHWELFKHIAQNDNFSDAWESQILFFGEKWFSNKNRSEDWQKFRNYLFGQIWKQASYVIDKFKFTICWEKFAETISLRRLHPTPYLIDHVKHLLSIIAGNFPAFRPIELSEDAAPTKGLQNAFINVYMLKQYLPTILHACSIRDTILKPSYLYYSLSLPTVLEGSPLKRTSSTIAHDLREMKLLIETLKNHLKDKSNAEVNNIIKNLDIDYFHHEKDICGEIRTSSEIMKEDSSFMADMSQFPTHGFCPSSPFFSGCLRMAPIEK